MENLKVLFAASEAAPFAKTGGLADVAGSLPKTLRGLGVDIRVVIPKYKTIPGYYTDRMEFLGHIFVDVGWRHQYCGIFRLVHENVTFYFIDNAYYFDRNGLYGFYDEAEQFTFFSRALIESLPFINFKPDIIHCNDWQTSMVSLFLKSGYSGNSFFSNIKTLYTIHNLKYQGIFPKEIMSDLLALDWKYFNIDGVEFFNCVNFMKSGILYSDAVSTVSKTYAEEIKTDFYGEKLNNIIEKRSDDLYGITNGIDYDENNPSTDPRIYANFSLTNIEGKKVNKAKLQEQLGLPVREDVPLIGIISRLVDQKGFDLLNCVFDEFLSEDVQLVVLGTGDPVYEDMFRKMSGKYPQKLSATISYDAVLAQKIYAGADLFLMPSLFEPCGLSQIISMRYGTIPIVRKTGGLSDTVKSYDEYSDTGNGFSFSNYNAHDMLHVIRRAINFYRSKEIWGRLVLRAMSQDFSWERSAGEYIGLYKRIIDR